MADARDKASKGSRRPWYLVLALLICSGLGACGSTAGWGTIEIFRGATFDNRAHDFTREEDTKAIAAAGDRILSSMDEERPKAFALAAGDLVLGVAMFIFAAAAMTGRGGARRVLVQLMLAQAALVIATFLLTPKSRHAQIDWVLAQDRAKAIEAGQNEEQFERARPALSVFYTSIGVAQLVLRGVIATLVVVALTRRRSREFYETQANET